MRSGTPPVTFKLDDLALMSRAKNYFAWQARLVKPWLGQRVLEAGCGNGNFTAHLLDRELVVALDVDPDCIAKVRARYADARNLRTMVADASRFPTQELATFRLDSCVCLNVLEHIADDRAALAGFASVISKGGNIVLIVPAFPALYGPIDRNLQHQRRHTKASMRKLARACGLQVRKLQYVNFVGFFGWWINARILRRETQSAAQIVVFDKLIVPILSRLESVVSPPVGQSLLVVLTKK
jgi:SAM-dependent methyltransferase